MKQQSGTSFINGGGAKGAEDKVIQHNGGGTVKVDSFCVRIFFLCYIRRAQFDTGYGLRKTLPQLWKLQDPVRQSNSLHFLYSSCIDQSQSSMWSSLILSRRMGNYWLVSTPTYVKRVFGALYSDILRQLGDIAIFDMA